MQGATSRPSVRPTTTTSQALERSIAIPFPPLRSRLFLRFDGNQSMLRLPLLIRILPASGIEEEVIVGRGVLEIPQVIVGRGLHKICSGDIRQKLIPRIESVNHEGEILVLPGGECKSSIRFPKIGLEFHRVQKFSLSFREFLLRQQSLAKTPTKFGIVAVSDNTT